MRNGETSRNGCTQPKRTHKRKAPNLALPLGELAKIFDFRLRGQQRYMLWSVKKTLSAQCAHWAPLPKGEARRRAAAGNYEPATLAVDPHLWGAPGSLQLSSLNKGNVPFVGRWHAPAAHVGLPLYLPSSTAPKPSPSGEGGTATAVTDEGCSVKPTTSAKIQRFHPSSVKNQRFLPASPKGEA